MLLDLEILITVVIHVVVNGVSPVRIVGISLVDLVGPPWHILIDLLLTAHQFIEVLVHQMIVLGLHSVVAFHLILGNFEII
jgi:hypothetical protein